MFHRHHTSSLREPRPCFFRFVLSWHLAVGLLLLQTPMALFGAPTGPQVVAGSASFVTNGALTTITAANNSIINYSGFNILQNETVLFVQPSSTARVLNRVQSADPTQILGSLRSNGI